MMIDTHFNLSINFEKGIKFKNYLFDLLIHLYIASLLIWYSKFGYNNYFDKFCFKNYFCNNSMFLARNLIDHHNLNHTGSNHNTILDFDHIDYFKHNYYNNLNYYPYSFYLYFEHCCFYSSFSFGYSHGYSDNYCYVDSSCFVEGCSSYFLFNCNFLLFCFGN